MESPRVHGALTSTKSLQILLVSCLYYYLPAGNAESRSLRYYFTTTSSPGPGQPYYHVGGYVDDVQVVRYTTETRRVQPLLSCLEDSMDPQHWVNQTDIAKYYENRQQQIIHEIKRIKPFNQTKGHRDTYVFQVKFWCVLSGDNCVSGYEEFAENGEEFISLDTYLVEFVALTSVAQTITEDWNSRKLRARRQKSYMEHDCIMWLKQYMECECLKQRLKTVRPQMKVSGHQSDRTTKLHCLVYGFYPRSVDVWWMKNEQEKVLSGEDNRILPHPDGTYQTTVTVEVPVGEERYSCHVDHNSLEKTLSEKLALHHLLIVSKTNRSHIGVYFAAVLITIILLVVLYLKVRQPSTAVQASFPLEVEPGIRNDIIKDHRFNASGTLRPSLMTPFTM